MGSKLAELQAKYKQKQLQEMEIKLRKLIPNAGEPKTASSIHIRRTTLMTSEKKVLPEERRSKDGIDRSHPLKPLKVSTVPKGKVNVSNSVKKGIVRSLKEEKVTNDLNSENEITIEEPKVDDLNLENKLKSLEIRDKPVLMKKSLGQPLFNKPLAAGEDRPALSTKFSNTANAQGKSPSNSKPTSARAPPPKDLGSSRAPPGAQAQPAPQRAPTANRPTAKQAPRGPSAVTRDNLAACKFCNRRFAPDRLQVHEDICARTGKKKRKTYDALRHRVQGTELEPFVKKGGRPTSKSLRSASSKKNNWRQSHTEFITTIRAAKMAQAHIAKGGKLSDLPPPPPSSNPDYVQCPHCGRRFNQTAAERHIPKCATYEFNKPKAAAARGRGGPSARSAR